MSAPSVSERETTAFTNAEDTYASSDGESIATSDSSEETGNDTSDDDSFVEKSSPVQRKKSYSTTKVAPVVKSNPQYKFAQFNSDATKTLRPFKEPNDRSADTSSFTVVAINRHVSRKEMHCFQEKNLDYSIVRSENGNVYRALFCKDLNTFAVLTASAFDNTAVQTVLRKQTAVRKSKEICEYSLDTTKACPSNFAKLAKKLDIDKGGIVFSTVTAKMYLEKVKSTPVVPVQKRSAEVVKDSVEVPCKKAKTEKPFLAKLNEIAKEGFDKKHSLDTCKDFIEKVYNHAAFSKTLVDLGCP